jgi:outer membrane protein assembly factor BamB
MVVKDKEIYVSDLKNIKVLGTNGEIIRSIPDDTENDLGLIQVTPAIGDGYLIVATQTAAQGGFLGLFSRPTNVVVKLDIETGEELWRFDQAQGQFFESGTISGDTFVIGNSDYHIYALDIDTGTEKWSSYKTGHRVWATPLIAEDTIYIGSMDRHMYALNLDDGTVIWSQAYPGAFASTPVLKDDTLYIGTFANQVHAINAADGTEKWHFSGENWFWGSPAVDDDSIYIVDVKGNVYALDAETGQEKWPANVKLDPMGNDRDAPVRGGPALSNGGSTLLISSENGTLYALDTADGSEKWRASGEGKGYEKPIIDGDIVYETQIHGTFRVRALELENDGDDYKALWVYPPPEAQETGE